MSTLSVVPLPELEATPEKKLPAPAGVLSPPAGLFPPLLILLWIHLLVKSQAKSDTGRCLVWEGLRTGSLLPLAKSQLIKGLNGLLKQTRLSLGLPKPVGLLGGVAQDRAPAPN